ncbi:hypothetical protein [Aeoliella mucimassa]|uniref:hypothetical protein n=1 Tax=Aeoliella mucimassa TaxID=2527972 RepID=UPI0018D2B0F8|nr:hypothetical protein [Aeoliella mucimassa]
MDDLYGDGTIHVSSSVLLDANLRYDASSGNEIITSFGSGGLLNIAVGNRLDLGWRSHGSLEIVEGAILTSGASDLGRNINTSGTVNVSGPNSQWTISSLLSIGGNGTGALTVEDGGVVTTRSLQASLDDLHGDGTVNVTDGALLDATLDFNTSTGTKQEFRFGSGGTLFLETGSDILGVGYKSNGSLSISDGIAISSDRGYLGLLPGSAGSAVVTEPGSEWSLTDSLAVGVSGNGSLLIDAGGEVSNSSGTIGSSEGSIGTVTVTGPGSRWDNSFGLWVGSYGSGSLRVEDGGQVTSWFSNIGNEEGATGVVTITGIGSQWTNDSDLHVGRSGHGSLTVEDGGQVITKVLYASLDDLHGNGSITATEGAVLDADLYLSASSGNVITTTFGAGGTLVIETSRSVFGVGCKDKGTVIISDGTEISSDRGYLGYMPGSDGAATVTGSGSKWTSNALWIGRGGNGSLLVEAGGQVDSSSGYLTGSSCAATITGAGSLWSASSRLEVGGSNEATLLVQDGGQVHSGYSVIGNSRDSTGLAIVTGNDSQWIAGSLSVGAYGNGTLLVEDGGQVSSNFSITLGESLGSTGHTTISGPGSQLTIGSNLYVGRSGTGVLTVDNGGQVVANTLYAAIEDLHGDGTIAATNGAVLDADIQIDATSGSTQEFEFGSGGTLTVALQGYTLGVGSQKQGSLTISNGAVVANGSGHLGYHHGSDGSAIITGAGSVWDLRSFLTIGRQGDGSMLVEAGGEIRSNIARLGLESGASGTVSVTGAESLWTSSSITIGSAGSGSLTVENGGQVITSSLSIGSAGSGSLTVETGGQVITGSLSASLNDLHGDGSIIATTGAVLDADIRFDSTSGTTREYSFGTGGTLTVQWDGGPLGVGNKEEGSLVITDGIMMSSSGGILGRSYGSTGTAIVSGAGTQWNSVIGTIVVGANGSGALMVEAAGAVNALHGNVGERRYSRGSATISGVGSLWDSYDLNIGVSGDGAFAIETGGQARSVLATLGTNSDSTGVAVVSGADSVWSIDNSLVRRPGSHFL